VETSVRIIDQLCRPDLEWDLLLVDLNGLPNLSILGISDGAVSDIGFLVDLELDGYMFTLPRPEDLIVRVPRLAANYLCDTGTLTVPSRRRLVA